MTERLPRRREGDVWIDKKPMAPDDPRHGTNNGYQNLGCNCDDCRDAHAVWHREWMAKHPEQRWKHMMRSRRDYAMKRRLRE